MYARIPANCAFTSQHSDPDTAQTSGASPRLSLGMPNGGLQVLNPSAHIYSQILQALESPSISNYEFADQSMLGDLFYDRWVPLPYVYNALKTMRWEGVHSEIWRDEMVKNCHVLLSPKPWDERPGEESDETHRWWNGVNERRREEEREKGVEDGF